MSVSALQRAAAPHMPTTRPSHAAVGASKAPRTTAARPVPSHAIASPTKPAAMPTHVETSLDHHDLFAAKPQQPDPITSGSDCALEEQRRRQRDGSLGPGVMTQPLLTAPIASATQGAASVQDLNRNKQDDHASSSSSDDPNGLPKDNDLDQGDAFTKELAASSGAASAVTATPIMPASVAQAMYHRALGSDAA